MAKTAPRLNHDLKITIELSINEACALGAIAGYGAKEFIECFKKNMGTHYIRDHEECIPALFDSLRGLDTRVQDYLGNVNKVNW
jgi:hypothetical protein